MKTNFFIPLICKLFTQTKKLKLEKKGKNNKTIKPFFSF